MKNTLLVMTAALALGFSTASAQRIEIRRAGSEPSGYLGIRFNETFERGQNNVDHVIVREVSKDSPAEKAGLKTGDEITRINGLSTGNGKFSALARTLSVGDTVELRVLRDGKTRDFTLVAIARPAEYAFFDREITIAPDSVRRLMLRFLDTARVHLDSLRLPSIHIVPDDSVIDLRIMRGGFGDSLAFRNDTSVMRLFRTRPGDMQHLPREWGQMGPDMIFRSVELGSRSIGGAELTE